MNRDILKSAIDEIKAGEEFKKRVTNLMIEKNNSKAIRKKSFKGLITAAAFFIMFGAIMFSKKYITNLQYKIEGSSIKNGINSMFIYDGRLFYTDYKNVLYNFDSASGKSKKQSKIDITNRVQVFHYKGCIYYSSGSAIYEKSIKDGALRKLLTGENLGVSAVGEDRLYYSIGYKDKLGGFSEFEYHIYELSTKKDRVLFKRSHNMWYIMDVKGDVVIADAYMPIVENDIVVGDDAGTYIIELNLEAYKKISSMRALQGCLAQGKFYCINNSAQLCSISLENGKITQIQLPYMDKKGYMVDSITIQGDTLYAGVHFDSESKHNKEGQFVYDEESYAISIDLKTGKKSILKKASSRIYKLCTDGKILYAYESGFPYNEKGNINVIKLK